MSRAFVLLIVFFLFCCSSLYVSGSSGSPIAEYSETLAKYLVLVSSAVYQGPSSSNQCIAGFSAIRPLSITHRFTAQYRGIELFGFAGVDASKQRIIFSYRGTYQFKQLLQELTTFIPRPVSTRLPDIKINTYFRNAQQALWSQTKQAIIELQNKYPQYQILFTGHSLGAAIAAVNAFDIYQQGLFKTSNVVLYTFGQPRTGNIAFARYMDQNIPTVYRLVHNRDIVAHLPPCFTKLLTRGCATDNKQYAYHHGIEIWYKEDMPSVFGASAFDAVDFDSLTEDQFDSIILDEEIPQTEEMELDDNEEEYYDSEAEVDSAFDFDAAGFTSRRNTYIVRRDADSANNENFDSPTEQLAQKAAKKQINIREAEINSGINLDLLDIKSADGQNEFEPIDPNFNDQKMLRGHTISAERPQDNDLLLKLQPARSQVALQTSHNALDHSGLLNTREAMAEINSVEAEFDAAADSATEFKRCSNESQNCSDGLLFKISVSDHQYYFQIEVKRHCNGLKQ